MTAISKFRCRSAASANGSKPPPASVMPQRKHFLSARSERPKGPRRRPRPVVFAAPCMNARFGEAAPRHAHWVRRRLWAGRVESAHAATAKFSIIAWAVWDSLPSSDTFCQALKLCKSTNDSSADKADLRLYHPKGCLRLIRPSDPRSDRRKCPRLGSHQVLDCLHMGSSNSGRCAGWRSSRPVTVSQGS